MPEVTVVEEPRANALPMATTGSPTATLDELAKVTVGRFLAPTIWSRATSLSGSVPTRRAVWRTLELAKVTAICWAPSITWLLVMTSPVEVTTMPVPSEV